MVSSDQFSRVVQTPNSQSLRQWHYTSADRLLQVWFRKSTRDEPYLYAGVPVEVATGLLNAKSAGAYFAANIAKNPAYKVSRPDSYQSPHSRKDALGRGKPAKNQAAA